MATTRMGSSGPFRIGRDWLRSTTGYGALRRAMRAAILMPALFAITDQGIGNPEIAYFAAFGSFAMLLLVDFPGTAHTIGCQARPSSGSRVWCSSPSGRSPRSRRRSP